VAADGCKLSILIYFAPKVMGARCNEYALLCNVHEAAKSALNRRVRIIPVMPAEQLVNGAWSSFRLEMLA
jgi:hypothetical protein